MRVRALSQDGYSDRRGRAGWVQVEEYRFSLCRTSDRFVRPNSFPAAYPKSLQNV